MSGQDQLPEAALLVWLAELGHAPAGLEPLTGDVSARRYARVRGAPSDLILVTYPPEMLATCERFAATTRLLEAAGIRVPEVLAFERQRGWMVLEDVGEATLYDLSDRPWAELRGHLVAALAVADRFAGLDPDAVAALNPPLDAAALTAELAQTWEAFLLPQGLSGGAAAADSVWEALRELCQRLGDSPAVPCHRDFMARNLIPGADGQLAVIDHQDLRLGPRFYDVASLLNDSLFPPPELEAELLTGVVGSGVERLEYRRAAAQRTLKAIGTFAAFARRGNPRHLELIPPTLTRALHHLEAVPETRTAVARVSDLWRRFVGERS